MWQAWSVVSFVDDARHETTQALAVRCWMATSLHSEIGEIGVFVSFW